MKKKIIASLLILFALFLTGTGIAMFYLYNTTSNLQSVINLHKVEIIRQDLVINTQAVQSHLYSFGTSFGQELDVIVENVLQLEDSANKCLTCHHEPQIEEKLREVESLVGQYMDALSYLITTSSNKERVERLRMVAIGIGTNLLGKVQDMSVIAGKKLNDKSYKSLQEIKSSRIILIVTLILSFFIAIAIAVSMTRQVTEPIYELLDATRLIKDGKLGFTTQFKAKGEFEELINAFNEMSIALESNNKEILKHINNLSNLYSVTLTFHSMTNRRAIYKDLSEGVADLVGAEQSGLMLLNGDSFEHMYPAVGLDREAAKKLTMPHAEMLSLYSKSNRRAFVRNTDLESMPSWKYEQSMNLRNIMYVWIKRKGQIIGAIRAANKRSGEFIVEDIHPLAILANNISVALENASLYENLSNRMTELQSAQEQLVQAAKLVAIGELASNVAHELNNPLTTVLGYAELMKEEGVPQKAMADIEVIEKECLRAKEIVRQLLEFARKRSLNIIRIDLNLLIGEVLDLVNIQLRKHTITLEKQYGENVTVSGDANQLKQVFINIIHNAIQSMGHDGRLTISTRSDEQNVYVSIRDTGSGIEKENLLRIFEPFFSTKKDKGTGIGLSVSYQIVKSHGGRIDVESDLGTGSVFTVVLPLDGALRSKTAA